MNLIDRDGSGGGIGGGNATVVGTFGSRDLKLSVMVVIEVFTEVWS